MIDPFEYEQTRTDAPIRENKVERDSLDTSTLDRALGRLNNFSSKPQHESFVEEQAPFTAAFQEEFGRVQPLNMAKSDYQSEVLGTKGVMHADYDVSETRNVVSRDNASMLIHKYLDKDVGYTPPVLETVEPVDRLRIDEPVLQPGISFIDSRKNMAVHF